MHIVFNLPLGANVDEEVLRALLDAGRTIEQRGRTYSMKDVAIVLQSCARKDYSNPDAPPLEFFRATLTGILPSSVTPGLAQPLLKREE